MSKWTEARVGDQSGRIALVTGANSGIGWETARVLASNGAHVVVACRSADRGHDAVRRIQGSVPSGSVEFLRLDLADLASVREAAAAFSRRHDRLDLLINNAGLMATPQQRTAQNFEMQFGVNHLGHFALTGLLLPRMLRTPDSRIVTVSSTAHVPGRIRFDDLNWESEYRPWAAYSQSKLANLLFTFELQRRLESSSGGSAALASHPGVSNTNLGHENAGGFLSSLLYISRPLMERYLSQSSAMGALPTLRAAVDPEARGGEYYGPGGLSGQTGHPVRVRSSGRSKDRGVAERLWRESEDLTGVKYEWTAG